MWEATTKPGATLEASFIWFYEEVPFNFPVLQRALITQGSYTFARASAAYQMASSKLFRTRFELDAGTFYDGRLITATVGPTWNISKDRKSTRLNSSHVAISYAVFCLKKKKK